jgi:CBS domain-containing protein
MPIEECCNIGVICCGPDAPLTDVAALMRTHHVGDVIVVKFEDDKRIPVGIVTDRDIVVETIAMQVDAAAFTAGDLMSTPVVSVDKSEGLVETLRLMRSHKIRRMPVVTPSGALFGIVTADDVMRLLSAELSMMTMAIAEQPVRESRLRK